MCGRPSTTIGFERRFNPVSRLQAREFVAALEDGVPPRPLNMTAIEATNRGQADMEWAMLTTAPAVEELTVEALAVRAASSYILDVREPQEYARGHVPRAVNIPQADLASRLADIPRDTPVIVVCQVGQRSLRAAQFLKQVGLASVAGLKGGTSAWQKAGLPVEVPSPMESARRRAVVESAWAHAGGSVRP
jgi:rhodanese-related sulfurtransferase